MDYILCMNGHYYFNRRVPVELYEYDSRRKVRFSLKTDSRKEAIRLASLHNNHLENYWRGLIETGNKHSNSIYEAIVKRARLLGFGYKPVNSLSETDFTEIINRLDHVKKENYSAPHIQAILGGIDAPIIKLDQALIKYWEYSTEIIISKSPNQLRKWKRPRERAIENLISVIGNKPVTEICRDDLLRFKDWWLRKIQDESLGANSANKNLVQIKVIFEAINDNLNLKIDIESLFRKLLLKESDESRRLPFESSYIVSTLLNPDNLSGLNEQAKWVLYAIAETGAGISEQVGLMPEDIVLDHDIPHIIIQPRSKKALKTKYRKRIIPLVGFALDAFKACPDGFTDYRDRPDSLSGALSKYLKENKLLPTDQHTVYSLRHSFQDRLLAVNAPDRLQADLMGHKFNRHPYGDGASLKQKLEWLKKIRLKNG